MTPPIWQVGKSYRTKGGHRAKIVCEDALIEDWLLVEHHPLKPNDNLTVMIEHNPEGCCEASHKLGHFGYFDLTEAEWEEK